MNNSEKEEKMYGVCEVCKRSLHGSKLLKSYRGGGFLLSDLIKNPSILPDSTPMIICRECRDKGK